MGEGGGEHVEAEVGAAPGQRPHRPGRRRQAPSRRRRRLLAGGAVLVAVAVALLVRSVIAGDDGPGGEPTAPGGLELLVPDELPEGFDVLESRVLPQASPFTEGSRIRLRVFGRARGDDRFAAGDLGLATVRTPGVTDASGFSPDATPVEVGERTFHRAVWEMGEHSLTFLVWDVEPGTVAFAASRTLDDAELQEVAQAVRVDDRGVPELESEPPAGLRHVATGDGTFPIAGTAPADAEGYEVDYIDRSNPSRRLLLGRWRTSVEWEPLAQWWFAPTTRTPVDGAAAMLTVLPGPGEGSADDAVMIAWTRDGVATVVFANDMAEAEILTIAEELRPPTEEEQARIGPFQAPPNIPTPPGSAP